MGRAPEKTHRRAGEEFPGNAEDAWKPKSRVSPPIFKTATLRAQIEKQSGRRIGKIAADARADTNAAVVETLAASQADLGVSPRRAAKPVAPDQLSAGQRVTVKSFKQPVVFRRHDGRMAEVEAGPHAHESPARRHCRHRSATAESREADAAAGARRDGITVHAQPSDEPAAEEINVIGCTVEEATRRVDKFIDEAALAGKPAVRIIHGHGTGALRRGLAEFLSRTPWSKRSYEKPRSRRRCHHDRRVEKLASEC